jgi:hypothetical protein
VLTCIGGGGDGKRQEPVVGKGENKCTGRGEGLEGGTRGSKMKVDGSMRKK